MCCVQLSQNSKKIHIKFHMPTQCFETTMAEHQDTERLTVEDSCYFKNVLYIHT